jgi:ABC-type branched-subunit amino acid transport system ATPase component
VGTSAPILATRNLGLDIGGARIVADVSLEVRAGELVGINGPNGAGKTTLFNLLSGLMRPTAGSVELKGRDVTGEPPFRRTRAGLGRTFQVSSVFALLSVRENVRLAADAELGGTMKIWRRAASIGAERAERALERVGRDVAARQLDAAHRRSREPREQIEERRLAGSVRADDPDELARADLERDIGDDLGAADVEPEVARCEDRS